MIARESAGFVSVTYIKEVITQFFLNIDESFCHKAINIQLHPRVILVAEKKDTEVSPISVLNVF